MPTHPSARQLSKKRAQHFISQAINKQILMEPDALNRMHYFTELGHILKSEENTISLIFLFFWLDDIDTIHAATYIEIIQFMYCVG